MFQRIAIIALLAVSLASAKSYSFTVADPAQAGATQLKPGEYHIKLDGSDVVLTDNEGRRIDVSAKLEQADQKFNATSVFMSREEGTPRITAIELGGSKLRIVFE